MFKKPFKRTKKVGVHDIPEKIKRETGLADADDRKLGKLVEETSDKVEYLIIKETKGLAEETSFPFLTKDKNEDEETNPFRRNFAGTDIPPVNKEEE